VNRGIFILGNIDLVNHRYAIQFGTIQVLERIKRAKQQLQ